MLPLDYVLALALLAGSPDASLSPGDFVTLRPVLSSLAIDLELLDPREARYLLQKAKEFESDLKLLRRRYRDLRDAPLVCDALRFPPRDFINEVLNFNRAYQTDLRNIQGLERLYVWELDQTIQETEYLYQVWDTLRDSRSDYYYVTVRRQALQNLRQMIGFQAYYQGCLPPYVPIWRFASMD